MPYVRQELRDISQRVQIIGEDLSDSEEEISYDRFEDLDLNPNPFESEFEDISEISHWGNEDYRAYILAQTAVIEQNSSEEGFASNYDLNVYERANELARSVHCGNNFKANELRYLANTYANEASRRGLDVETIKDDQKILLMSKGQIRTNVDRFLNEIVSNIKSNGDQSLNLR